MRRARLQRVSAVALLTGAGFAAPSAPALADPSGGSIVQASDAAANSIGGAPGAVVITQGSDRIAIDWETFSIDNGQSVTFLQPGNQAIALNRVIGSGGPIPQSVIDGVLQANGHVWLLNPSGIAFGSNANVDVGGLLATSADIDPATFIALDPTTDTYAFAGGTAAVTNAGDLDAQGLMALVAPVVTNSGDLTSSHGDVLLGGAEAYRLKFVSTARNNGAAFDELLVTDFIIDTASSGVGAGGDVVHQTAAGRAIGGRVIANASRAGGGAFLNMEGLVEAQDVGALSGDVFLLGGVDITGGTPGATATDAIKTDNMTIVAPGTATGKGTSITIGGNAGPPSTGGGASSTGNIALTATSGDITTSGDFDATAGTISFIASNGAIDAGDLTATGDITLTAQDIDIVGTNRSIASTGGAVSLTATGGGASNISSTGVLDIDGDSVSLSGPVTATSIDIDADNGGVAANGLTASGGSVSIDATGAVDVDDVSATTTARVVSSAGAVDVGNVTGPGGVTISGTDVDLTGAGGSVQASGGTVAITATGGGANNISAAGAIDIDGDVVTLSGSLTGTGVDILADVGNVTAGDVTATAGNVRVDTPVNITLGDVTASGTVVIGGPGLNTDSIDVGDISGATSVGLFGTDIDLVGTNGSVRSANGFVQLTARTATDGISSAGAIDIDAHSFVALHGNLSGGDNITVDSTASWISSTASTGDMVSTTSGSVALNAPGTITVGDVTATTTASVTSTGDAVDVGNVTAPGGITVSGTDIDLTGAGGILLATGGAVALTASGGGANNISSATSIDVDGTSVSLSGPVTATNNVAVTASTGNAQATGSVSSTTGSVVIEAANGDVDVTSLSGATGVTVAARDVDLTGAVNGGTGTASLTATAGNISTPNLFDVDAGAVLLSGPVTAGGGIDIDAATGGVTASGGSLTATGGTVDVSAPVAVVSLDGVSSPGDLTLRGAAVTFIGNLVAQGQILLEAFTGSVTGTGTSSITGPNAGLTARAIGGTVTLNDVTIGNDLSALGGAVTVTGSSTVGGTASLQALSGNVHVAGELNALGGILLIEAPSGAAVINEIASSSDVSLVVLDLDLTGTISAGDQFNLTPAGTGRTIVLGGSGGSDGVVFRLPQGFTLDASEITRISASKLQFNAGNNDLALLSATFDPAMLQELQLGTGAANRIIAGGDVRGLPSLKLGYQEGGTDARPELILVSGSLGEDSTGGRIESLRLSSRGDIVIGTQAFFDAYEASNGDLDLATLAEPNLGQFQATEGHVFIAADQLRLASPGEIVQLNTGTGQEGKGVVFQEATGGDATIEAAEGGPTRVNLFGVVINAAGERISSFDAGLEPNLLDAGVVQNGELRLNLCVIGNSASCSIAILREAQESARSRNSALSSLTNNTLLGFEDNDFDDEDDEDDLGGVAGAGNESLWGIGLP